MSPTCDRRDLNPGPPAWQAIKDDKQQRKIALVTNLRQIARDGNLDAFAKWLTSIRRISEKTAKDYVSAFTRPNVAFNRNTTKAYRLFAKFAYENNLISRQFRDEILEEIKIPPSHHDLRVPTVEEVRKTLSIAKEYSENVYYIYRLAVESGSRLSEILTALQNPERDICEPGICYYPLNWTRGYKGSYYLFHLTPLRHIDVTRFAIADFERRHKDAVKIKYVRKFVSTQMASLGIPFDVIDFIQGRKPTRVLTQHYVSLFGIARNEYRRYAEWLHHVQPL